MMDARAKVLDDLANGRFEYMGEAVSAARAALAENNQEAWVAALLNAPNPEQALAATPAEPKGTWSDGGKVWEGEPATPAVERATSASPCLNCGDPSDELFCGTCREMGCSIPATPAVDLKAASKGRIERAKEIREEQQCSLQEAVRLERAEFLTSEIKSASSIEDLKTILLSIVNYRYKA